MFCCSILPFRFAIFWGTIVGESLVVAWVLGCLGVMIPRIVKGADLPPPGFVLVLMGFVCALFAALISLFAGGDEWDAR